MNRLTKADESHRQTVYGYYMYPYRLCDRRFSCLCIYIRELHESGFIQETFGREIPVLIHELEYYYEIGEQNIRANGIELVEDFARFCGYLD